MHRHRILNAMKRLEVVLERGRLEALRALLAEHATGYTVVPNVQGFGHHGGRDDLALLVTVVTREHLDALVERVRPFLADGLGILTVSDVEVLRGPYFVPEVVEALPPDTP